MDENQEQYEPGCGYLIFTDPDKPPEWVPGPGWWEFINGVWRWISAPAPSTVSA